MPLDALLEKYDIYYINPSSTKMGFMLAVKKDGSKFWRREDERPLPDSFATGDISYANLSPDIQKIIAQRLMHGGFGALEHEVVEDADFYALRHLRSKNVDQRCRGKAYLGPKITELNLPTPPTYYAPSLTDGGLEVWTSDTDLTHWTEVIIGVGEVRKTTSPIFEGTYSAKLWVHSTGQQGTIRIDKDVPWHNEYRGHYFTFSARCKSNTANKAKVEIEWADGKSVSSSFHAGGDNWEKLTVTAKIPLDAVRLRVKCVFGEVTGTTPYSYFDKCELETTYSQAALNTVPCFEEFNGGKYGAFGNILAKLNTGTSTYDYKYHFPANITDLKCFVINGVEHLFVALGDDKKLFYLLDDPNDVLVEDCEDAWDEYVDANVTSSADTTDKKVGSASAKLVVATGAAAESILATEAISSLDLNNKDTISLWIKSSVALSANDLQLLFDDEAACPNPLLTVNIPAVESNTWTHLRLSYSPSSAHKGIVSVGVKMVVDKGIFTLWLDEIRADALPTEHDSEKLYHLAVTPSTLFGIKQAGGNKLRKATNPTGSWSDASAQYPGSPSDKQNDLQNCGGVIWILKEDGPYYLSDSSIIQPFPELETIKHGDAGKNSNVFLNRLYFRMGVQQEWEIDGADLTEVTPSLFAPGISNYNYPCVARAGDESWLYNIIRRGTTWLAILAGRWEYLAGATRWIWHEIRDIGLTNVACAFVSSIEGRPYLYLGSTNSSEKVYKVYLPVTNDATADSGYRFHTSGSLWSPKYRTLLFVANKLWRALTARSLSLSATKYINAYRSQDAGASFTLLGKLDTSPEQTLDYPSGIESTQMNLRLDFVSDSDTAGPVLLDYNLKAILMMASVARFNHTIKCAENLILKKNLASDTTISAIAAFINTIRDKICTLGDRDGSEHSVKVQIKEEFDAIDIETQRPCRFYSIEAVKIS